MNCQECEGLLASEESSAVLDGHLAECVECRELAADLRANSDAFREMTAAPMPSVSGAVLARVRAQDARRKVARWGWALAAAAAVLIMFGVTRHPQVAPTTEPPAPQVGQAVPPAAAPLVANVPRVASKRQAKPPAPQAPLKIKMFTSDPDVVIYWLVEPKEGSE
jgi:hypothetical protein